MTRTIERHAADIATGSRLVDEMIERYVNWREECAAVRASYQYWSSAEPAESRMAFAVYNAALDREECAAAVYAGAISSLERFLRPAESLAAPR